jgi:hypothetical protein
MKSFILYLGTALFLGYTAYSIYWNVIWFIESFKKDDEKESIAAKKAVGKLTIILLLGAVACAIILKLSL